MFDGYAICARSLNRDSTGRRCRAEEFYLFDHKEWRYNKEGI